MEEMGLAAQMGQEGPAGMGPGSKMDPMVAVQEVAAMLQQGATPEELVAAGIPIEVVEAAIALLMEQGQVQPQGPQGPVGLAGMQMVSGM